MKRIAFVTCAKQPHLYPSDELVVPLLKKNTIDVIAVPWNQTLQWNLFDLIVIRSAWDYPLHYEKFNIWLDSLHHLSVWNNVSTLRWNTKKTYLSTFEGNHIPIVPTHIVTNINLIPKTFYPWNAIVIKPAIGAWAFETKMFDESDTHHWHAHIHRLLQKGPVIIQQYMKEIQNGEYSCIFFDKKYSHSVLKIPKKGEFRVQSSYGGTVIRINPPDRILTQAQAVIDSIPQSLLYARVDGIIQNGTFFLLEVELCEPELFLDAHPHAPQKFCDTIVSYLAHTP